MLDGKVNKEDINIVTNIARRVFEVTGSINPYLIVNRDTKIGFNDLSKYQQFVMMDIIIKVMKNPEFTHIDLHNFIVGTQEERGWTYGEKYDKELKHMPMMKPFSELDGTLRGSFLTTFTAIKYEIARLENTKESENFPEGYFKSQLVH